MKFSLVFLASACAAVSQAAFVFGTGTIPLSVDENILFNDGTLLGTGPLVQGRTNNTNTVFNFFGAGEDLVTNGGQAKLDALDGAFTAVTMTPNIAGTTLTAIELNLNALEDGFATFVINGDPLITNVFAIDKSGENRLNVLATGGDTITSLALVSTVPLGDIKQWRVGGVQAVPEPASMAALGLGALGLLKRRKKA